MPNTLITKRSLALVKNQTVAKQTHIPKSHLTNQNSKSKTILVAVKKTSIKVPKPRQTYTPGQILVTKQGKRYIVGTDLKFLPLTSKKNARRDESVSTSRSHAKDKNVKAPLAGSVQLIDGNTYVVGEDRKTFIPITKSVASGQGVLTSLLEIVAVIAITDLVVDMIVDDLILDDLMSDRVNTSSPSTSGNGDFTDFDYGTNGWFDQGNAFF